MKQNNKKYSDCPYPWDCFDCIEEICPPKTKGNNSKKNTEYLNEIKESKETEYKSG
jgi:hypothetical protein